MSEQGERDLSGWLPMPNELTPEQGELLVEELKRFEPYLEAADDPWGGLEPSLEAAYLTEEGIGLHLVYKGGIEEENLAATWRISWIEDLGGETPGEAVVSEHRHAIVVTTTGQVAYSFYERIDSVVDPETGPVKKILSPEQEKAIEASRAAGDPDTAVKILVDSVNASMRIADEMKAMTGIDTDSFNTERFDTVMALLSKVADPARKL